MIIPSQSQYDSNLKKTPVNNSQQIHKDKIKKIMKFEKVMKKFCKDIGLDKKTLMAMMIGKDNLDDLTIKNDLSSSRKDLFS